MAQVEVPEDLILPEPKDDHERDTFNAIQDKFLEYKICIEKAISLIP